MPVWITDPVKVYHCTNGDRPFDRQIGFGTHFVRKSKFDGYCNGDNDGDGLCKWTLPSFLLLLGMSCEFSCKQRLVCINLVFSYHMAFLPPANECCEGYVFTRVCLSTGVGWYPSMHCRWYPSMPCSRSWGGVEGSGQGVSRPTLKGKVEGSGLGGSAPGEGGVVPAPGGGACPRRGRGSAPGGWRLPPLMLQSVHIHLECFLVESKIII